MLDREAIVANRWRFGSFFSSTSAPNIFHYILDEHKTELNLFLAVTHDCSVILPCLEKEPYLEYFTVHFIENPDHQFTYSRNTRCLHLLIHQNTTDQWVELKMANRGFAPRLHVESDKTEQAASLPLESLNTLKRWLSQRYIAQSFPDQFNDITKPLVKSRKSPLMKILTSEVGDLCKSLFISLTPLERDLSMGESYEMDMLLIMSDEDGERVGWEALESFEQEIIEVFETIPEINITSVTASIESTVVYPDLLKMIRWNIPDYISLKGDAAITSINHL